MREPATSAAAWLPANRGAMMADGRFWEKMEALVATSPVVIDRPKGTRHPRYPKMVYPLDYGYLEGTSSMDGGGIDVWVGSESARTFTALGLIVDLVKRDSEVKVLLGCTAAETEQILRFHNEDRQAAMLVCRHVPD